MPINRLIVPLINPVKFITLQADTIDKFRSRHFDDFFFMETIRTWQTRRQYVQPFQNSDRIILQFRSQLDPLLVSVIDIDEMVYSSTLMTQGLADADDPTLFIYECSIPLSGYSEGLRFLRIDGGPMDADGNYSTSLISEPIHIKPEHKDTVHLKYTHYEFYNDLIFETGISPELRIRATLSLKSLSSKDTFFEDQVLDMTMIQSKPFRIYTLRIGGPSGIPDYLADIINRILGCQTLFIDGKPYAKSDGAKLEDNGSPNYPMRGWSVDLREAENVQSVDFKEGPWLWPDGGTMLWDDDGEILRG
jgi:hypothetical protein